MLWGASFPLALAAVAGRGQDPGRLVGGVYAANTVGAIVGSLGTGLILVTTLHTPRSEQVLIVVSAIAGLMLLAPIVAGETGKSKFQWAGMILLVAATGGAGLLARGVAGGAGPAHRLRPLLGDVGEPSRTSSGRARD